MSDDLISRKQTAEMLRKYAESKFANGEIQLANGILKAVNYIENDNVPTAYDLDKVVEQIEDCGKYEGYLRYTKGTTDFDNFISVTDAKRIVKGGGVE